ncbi:hypothetical protein D3C73_1632580 [compost metagenome]
MNRQVSAGAQPIMIPASMELVNCKPTNRKARNKNMPKKACKPIIIQSDFCS